MDYIVLTFLVILTIIMIVILLILLKKNNDSKIAEKLDLLQEKLNYETLRNENLERQLTEKLSIFSENSYKLQRQVGDGLTQQISTFDKNNSYKFSSLSQSLNEQLSLSERRFQGFSMQTSENLNNIRNTLEKQLTSLQNDNNLKLDEMKKVVDEKLQETLNKRMNESFQLVNERLEQVYKGLGEMQNLANGVGDLKKVLTNVKSRGILGEIQLSAILQEILSPEQYETNIATIPNSKNFVEFAVKIPTENGEFVYLPIDSKFPGDSYRNLQDAYDLGDKTQVELAAKNLISTLKSEAKMIRDKYINSPYTTDFAIMFLPFEGLYAEAVNRGMVEILQNQYHINLAGPSTMAALLNSLQMGFRAFAIQKRSGEVWKVLSAVKTEFDKFEIAINSTQNRLKQANDELEKLVGTRTRQIQRSLKNVSTLDNSESFEILNSLSD